MDVQQLWGPSQGTEPKRTRKHKICTCPQHRTPTCPFKTQAFHTHSRTRHPGPAPPATPQLPQPHAVRQVGHPLTSGTGDAAALRGSIVEPRLAPERPPAAPAAAPPAATPAALRPTPRSGSRMLTALPIRNSCGDGVRGPGGAQCGIRTELQAGVPGRVHGEASCHRPRPCLQAGAEQPAATAGRHADRKCAHAPPAPAHLRLHQALLPPVGGHQLPLVACELVEQGGALQVPDQQRVAPVAGGRQGRVQACNRRGRMRGTRQADACALWPCSRRCMHTRARDARPILRTSEMALTTGMPSKCTWAQQSQAAATVRLGHWPESPSPYLQTATWLPAGCPSLHPNQTATPRPPLQQVYAGLELAGAHHRHVGRLGELGARQGPHARGHGRGRSDHATRKNKAETELPTPCPPHAVPFVPHCARSSISTSPAPCPTCRKCTSRMAARCRSSSFCRAR